MYIVLLIVLCRSVLDYNFECLSHPIPSITYMNVVIVLYFCQECAHDGTMWLLAKVTPVAFGPAETGLVELT